MRSNNISVVLDTNVLVSAALFPLSHPWQVFEIVRGQGSLIASVDTLAEVNNVLKRPRFDRYLRRTLRDEFLHGLGQMAVTIEINQTIRACRDPKDDKFLELAVCGNATHIVSGDQDLLALHPFRGISILSPRDFLIEAGGYA